jgi:beta-galactosidase/beta-glucuronidase
VNDPSYHPVLWYQRDIQPPKLAAGERLILHFGAVDYRCEAWINGQFAVRHEGGHTPFSADITELMGDSGNDIVTVRAEDNPEDLTQPRGKQYWEPKPGIIYYKRTSGIWQPVWLEVVPTIHIEEIRWTPDVPRFGVDTIIRFSARPPTG